VPGRCHFGQEEQVKKNKTGKIMNQFLLWNGLFSLLLALILGITAIYLGFSAFKFLNSHVDEEFELRNNNIAVALVSASFIVSLGILMKSVIDPITQTLFNLAHKYEQLGVSISEVLSTFGIIFLQFTITLLLSMATLTLGTRLYMRLNKQTDELQEIANNNIAVAIVVSAITLTLAMLLAGGMETFLNAIIPSPPILNENLPFN
jgi:uncharacterized membrane protein YjfL (UPF0719 family)